MHLDVFVCETRDFGSYSEPSIYDDNFRRDWNQQFRLGVKPILPVMTVLKPSDFEQFVGAAGDSIGDVPHPLDISTLFSKSEDCRLSGGLWVRC